MSAYLAEIWRHPIKSCGRETLTRVLLTENRTLPWDRRWAIAHAIPPKPTTAAIAPELASVRLSGRAWS